MSEIVRAYLTPQAVCDQITEVQTALESYLPRPKRPCLPEELRPVLAVGLHAVNCATARLHEERFAERLEMYLDRARQAHTDIQVGVTPSVYP